MEYQWLIDRVDYYIVNRSKTVVLAFLLVTAVMIGGLGVISSESGQEQFIEDLDSFEASEDIREKFSSTFSGRPTTSTTLVQESSNVLSKPALLDMLQTRNRIIEQNALRVDEVETPAEEIATTLNPAATTPEAHIRAIKEATPSQIDTAVREAAEDASFTSRLSDDFNTQSASATASQGSVTHLAGPGEGSSGGPGGASEFPANKVERIKSVVTDDASTIWVQGTPPNTQWFTTSIVLPVAFLLILLFLAVAYRDPFDIAIGLLAIVMTLLWTFGFLGIAGVAFTSLIIAVPPILIAIGVDFGIHSINRYREERVTGLSISESMTRTTDQMLVAFAIVAGTSVIGFLSNTASAFPPTRDFGLVAAFGVVFTFLIFGIFVPALKVLVDRVRQRYPIPSFANTPLGSDNSLLGRVLAMSVTISKRAPLVFLLFVLIATAGGGVYATGVDSGFGPEDFQPSEETPDYYQSLPAPIRPPEEFEYVRINNYLDRNFAETSRVLMYVQKPMTRDSALESIHRAGTLPPSTFESDQRQAESESIVTVIQSRAERDPEFRRLVERNDRNNNGIPDDNLPQIYEALAEPADSDLSGFLGDDRRSTQVVYTVDGGAEDDVVTEDAYDVAGNFRGTAQPTGGVIIFDEALSLVLDSVIDSLVLTLVGASAFLVFAYWVVEGRATLGLVNVVPIIMTVVAVVATMRLIGIKFNAINGTILAIAVGIGIDYAVHVVHRFADEYHEKDLYPALQRTIVGTGGALFGSMLTTVSGIGTLMLALNPGIGTFGILISLSVLYAFLLSILVVPSTIVVWARLVEDDKVDIPVMTMVSDAVGSGSSTATE
ncbi:MAG: putative exporters of the RND superfamily [uncultured archaeon A07HN63]|nr:MAG: putative exporters of the RND superfamily [uncultured archaeon A07HN63]